MPEVSEDFVKSAKMLSQAVPGLLDKIEEHAATPKEAAINVRVQAEVVADTLVQQGLVKDTEKSAAVEQLCDHKESLNILNRTAQNVTASSMGSAPVQEKAASDDDDDVRESDRVLLSRLGFNS